MIRIYDKQTGATPADGRFIINFEIKLIFKRSKIYKENIDIHPTDIFLINIVQYTISFLIYTKLGEKKKFIFPSLLSHGTRTFVGVERV
jgi:hypothetical protein